MTTLNIVVDGDDAWRLERFNRKTHKNNRTGLKGVYCDQRRKNKPWHAQIRVDGKKVYLGSFAASAEAFAAYVAAARKYHGEFARFA